MKTKNMLWAALSMTAALVMTACTNDDNMAETSAAPQDEVNTIPYSVTVSGGATTRATVDETDMKTLYFAAGDKLYIRGEKDGKYISGALDIQTGMGTASATFSGTLNYTGEGTPPDDTLLRGWLIGSGDKLFMITDGEVKGYTYPATYCADVATAVKEYSYLWNMADVTYASRTFTLEQQTAFLNFVITFDDGTKSGTALSAVVSNNGKVIATADVTTKTDTYGNVVAEFVLPFDTGDKLKGATVKMGDKEAISFGGADQTLEGKVYNVKRTYAATLSLTSPAVGQVIGSDGKNYAAGSVPTGVTAVAMIAYVEGTSNGLAIALADEGEMNWTTAGTTAAAHTPAFTGGEWKLPSQPDWRNMFYANGSDTEKYTGLNTALGNAGGTELKENYYYWSSTEGGDGAMRVYLEDDVATWDDFYIEDCIQVRACLAF